MKSFVITLLFLAIPSQFAYGDKAQMSKEECKEFREENKLVRLGMTRAQAFCIVKNPKLVREYEAQKEPYVGQPVQVFMKKGLILGGPKNVFTIIDDKVVHASNL